MATVTIPLFPVRTVLFPNGKLPLRIFEARYMDMVSYCLRKNTGFGICLIAVGDEVGDTASVYTVGTLAQITGWAQSNEGILMIEATGIQRFEICAERVEENNLIWADVEFLTPEPFFIVTEQYQPLVQLLQQVIAQVGGLYQHIPTYYDDLSWITQRFAELLPMKLSQRQTLLELDDPIQRLTQISQLLNELKIAYK